ncbi:MAG: hypothetical protein ACI9LM_003838 [Alteromonadaceae bacterium]|jgi:hypothetical protein
MHKINQLCQYQDPKGHTCPNKAGDNVHCYWHDTSVNKSGDEVKGKLQNYARNGGFLRGICLKKANLQGIDLVKHHSKTGYDFSYADFYRVNLKDAHLFNINLTHASLMKTDLTHANLNCGNLKKVNLLGVKWKDCKIENIQIGKSVKQEFQARQETKKGNTEDARDYFEQAEEVYRDLRKHTEHAGIFRLSGGLIQKELTMRRMQLPKVSIKRFTSKFVDLFCGYGEAPLRIIGISMLIILICAMLYTFTGLNYQGTVLAYSNNQSSAQNFDFFLSCIYYSVVTFTTLGYGDFTPVGVSRAIAAFEAFTGSFTLALFVVVFVKKMTR